MAVDPAWIALGGTIAGTVGLKVAEHFLGKGRVKIDDAAKIRDELRLQIAANNEEIKQLEAEAEKWRAEYYNLRDKYVALQTELTLALQKIKDEEAVEALKAAKDKTLDMPSHPVVDSHRSSHPSTDDGIIG
jgi:chromosome segregation ATPase